MKKMRRKLIKQGDNALTVTLPAKWIKENTLRAGNEVDILEEENKVILQKVGSSKEVKRTTLSLEKSFSQAYRSILGGLYRGGYDEVVVHFKEYSIIKDLQKEVENLYGWEIVDISKNSCLIKSLFQEEALEVKPHIQKMIYGIKVMQETIFKDISDKKFSSAEEILQFRNGILKQRDLIARTIVKHKSLDNKHFPFYLVAFQLWQVAKNYRYLYDYLAKHKKISPSEKGLYQKTINFFNTTFSSLTEEKVSQTLASFYQLREEIEKEQIKNNSAIIAYLYAVMLNIDSCKSSLLLLDSKMD